jgi:hypothetical protein
MYELVFALMVVVSAIVIHVFRNNNKQNEKDQTINEKELWPVSFFLLHEPRLEKQYEWFVTSEAYFQSYDTRLLAGIGRKEALRILALALRTNNLERLTKNGYRAYRVNGYILKNKETKFVVKNGNDKLVSVQISKITALRVIASSKIQKKIESCK